MAKIIKNNVGNFLVICLIFLTVTVWVFSGWPQIWKKPAFPPEIQEARAAVSFVEFASTCNSAGNTSVDVPTGTADNDVMIMVITSRDNAVQQTPSGWTIIGSQLNNTAALTSTIYFRVASSEPASYAPTTTAKGHCLAIATYRGADTTSPINASSQLNNASSATITATSITPTVADTEVVFIGTTALAGTQSGYSGTNPTFTERYDVNNDAGGATKDISVALASGLKTDTTATGNRTSTATVTAVNNGYLIALKPLVIVAPTVTTQAASDVEATTATGNGNIEATGGENASAWGVCYKTSSGCTTTDDTVAGSGSGGQGAFTASMTSLSTGTTYYINAYATNSAGTSYGDEVTILTKPAAPTDVAATDATYTDKVTITWTKSTGATDYHVWRDSTDLDSAGDVATFDDTGADAPTITPGSTVASDGTSTAQVDLSLSGTSANNGTTHTYKVVASNATGNSADSTTNTGHRGVGSLTYQWQKSSGDSDANYSNIDGATAATYNDTAAPAPTVTPGTASATDGSATDKVTLSISGASANNGEGRWYQCILNATGATPQTSTSNRGYRGVGGLEYQWYRSSGTGDSNFSILSDATTAPYDDTTAPAPTITAGTADASDGTYVDYVALSLSGQSANPGESRYYYCTVSATGASPQDTTHNDGYRSVGSLTYQWQRSSADSDANYSNIDGANTASYNDTGAPADGSGRYYQCVLNATDATEQTSTADRGYRSTFSPSLSFSISDTTIGFGTLLLNKARFATADEAGADGPTATSAHNLTITTNAPNGYTITYNGATLTSSGTGNPTISVATITNDQDGVPGTEQFAIGFANGAGDAAVVTAYDQELNNYSFVASTTTSIISETGVTSEETIAAYYLANISSVTEAGTYSTSVTYICTGNF